MATLGHLAVGLVAARYAVDKDASRFVSWGAMGLFAGLAFLPDADVIAFVFKIPYHAPFGHRGAFHSLFFALLLGLLAAVIAKSVSKKKSPWRAFVLVSLVVGSHGLLDALTDGGLGIALFWPFSNERFFAPWRPIPVGPIGTGLFSAWGLRVLVTEVILFAPLFVIALWPRAKEEELVEEEEEDFEEVAELPIDGTLDLHTFRPKEVKDLVPDYLEECLEKEIYQVRIIHGKGKGVLRRTVHGVLERLPYVDSYSLASDRSAWGATMVQLKPR